MKEFWNALNGKEKKRFIIIFVVMIVGLIGTIVLLTTGNFGGASLFGSGTQTKEERGDYDSKSNRDTESEDFYSKETKSDDAYENKYRDEVLELLAQFTDEGVKGAKKEESSYKMYTVTSLNGTEIASLSDLSEETLNAYLDEQGVDSSKYKNYSLNDKKRLFMGYNAYNLLNNSYKISEKKKKEYNDTKNEFDTLIIQYANKQYSSVRNSLATITDKYNLSQGSNKMLASLYADAALMKDYDKLADDGKQMAIQSHKNPVTLAVDTLYADMTSRNSVIVKKDSLAPYVENSVEVVSYKRLGKGSEDYNIHSDEYDETVNLYEVVVKVDSKNELACYIREDSDGKLTIDGYYDNTATPSNYRTMQFWIDEGIAKTNE